jgi:uncharacterized protein YutE (UPF0331/DUF86 family)
MRPLIIARNGLRTPEDYADTFRVMEEKGAFDSEFTSALTQMSRFRNRLVHIYWDMDDTARRSRNRRKCLKCA